MTDPSATATAPSSPGEAAIAFLTEMTPDLRGAAILAADGSAIAASSEPKQWAEGAAELFAVADAADGETVEQVHIATEAGELFGLRHEGLTAIAVTERFVLASLTFFDLRATLRELARGGSPDQEEDADAA